jgi:hypothetical protein
VKKKSKYVLALILAIVLFIGVSTPLTFVLMTEFVTLWKSLLVLIGIYIGVCIFIVLLRFVVFTLSDWCDEKASDDNGL